MSSHRNSIAANTPVTTVPISLAPTHPMVTRGKNGIFKPKVCHVDYAYTEPCDVKEALKHPQWKRAMEEEYNALLKNHS